jgi:ribulose-phosphate 3-epimerase
MSGSIKVSASILCANFGELRDEVKRCEDAGVDMFHIDIMDGHFVPVISIGQMIVDTIRPLTKLPLEVHLMVESPWRHLESFAKAGADILGIHAECYGQRREECREEGQYPKEVDSIDADRMRADLKTIRGLGCRSYMVINPGTPMLAEPVYDVLDGILAMSVNPGFSGQKFMPQVLDKVRQLKKDFNGDIAIDGGLSDQTAPSAVEAGANVIITASYLFRSADMAQAVQGLKDLAL